MNTKHLAAGALVLCSVLTLFSVHAGNHESDMQEAIPILMLHQDDSTKMEGYTTRFILPKKPTDPANRSAISVYLAQYER